MSRSSNHFSSFSMAFYDAVRQDQRINNSFHDEDCRIKLSPQALKSRCCWSHDQNHKKVAGQATCNNISLSLPRGGRRSNFRFLLSIVFRLCDLSLWRAQNIYISEKRKKITFTSTSKFHPLVDPVLDENFSIWFLFVYLFLTMSATVSVRI